MSLDLDSRQRAMLQQMGVHVWWPEAVAAPAASVPLARDRFAIENEALQAISTRAAAKNDLKTAAQQQAAVTPGMLASGIAGMAWPLLRASVAACQACKLAAGRRVAVFGAADGPAPRQADWLVVGEPPDDGEERVGSAFADQAGQLLDNMLKAVGVSRHGADHAGATAAYVTNVVKCRPAVLRNPESQELATCENYLRREVALVQPKVILALGRFAAQALLQGSLPEVASIPLGKLRGRIYRYQGIPVVVSYPPGYLLRTQQDKARAWADLCLALTLTGPVAG